MQIPQLSGGPVPEKLLSIPQQKALGEVEKDGNFGLFFELTGELIDPKNVSTDDRSIADIQQSQIDATSVESAEYTAGSPDVAKKEQDHGLTKPVPQTAVHLPDQVTDEFPGGPVPYAQVNSQIPKLTASANPADSAIPVDVLDPVRANPGHLEAVMAPLIGRPGLAEPLTPKPLTMSPSQQTGSVETIVAGPDIDVSQGTQIILVGADEGQIKSKPDQPVEVTFATKKLPYVTGEIPTSQMPTKTQPGLETKIEATGPAKNAPPKGVESIPPDSAASLVENKNVVHSGRVMENAPDKQMQAIPAAMPEQVSEPRNNSDSNRLIGSNNKEASLRPPDTGLTRAPENFFTQVAGNGSTKVEILPRATGSLTLTPGKTGPVIAGVVAIPDAVGSDLRIPDAVARLDVNVRSKPGLEHTPRSPHVQLTVPFRRTESTDAILPAGQSGVADEPTEGIRDVGDKRHPDATAADLVKNLVGYRRHRPPEITVPVPIKTSVRTTDLSKTPQSDMVKISFIQAEDDQPALGAEAIKSEIFRPLSIEQSIQIGTLRTAEAMVARPQTARMIASQMADAMFKAQNNKVEISLNPEELGRVRMVLTTTDIGVSVAIIAERPETLDLMRRHIELLADEFRNMGYQNMRFEFGEHESRRETADNSHQSHSGDQSADQSAMTNHRDSERPDPLPAARTTRSRGLDLRL